MFDFDKIIDRSGTASTKWEKYKGTDIIPLWVADSDFETAPEIIQAMQQRVAHGIFGYTLQPAPETQEAIIFHLQSEYDWTIEADWIIPLPSLVTGLNLASLCAGQPGDTIAIPATIYPPFKSAPVNAKRAVLEIPMKLVNERWLLDFEVLDERITADTKMLLLCNPHNPGGVVYTEDELRTLHTICQKHDCLICSDEIHCDLILEQGLKHIPIATLNADASNRTITLMAASKTFNIAGLGFGFAIIANPDLRSQFKHAMRGLVPEVNPLAQVATAAAFTQATDWRIAQNDYLRANRDYLMREINAIPGLKMYLPEGTFLAWIDVSALQLDDVQSYFESIGLGISAGDYFGDPRFMRLNFACPRRLLEQAVTRLKTALC